MDLLASKLDELDCFWSGESDRRHGLSEIIASLPGGLAGRETLVVELCCADLEWRWRTRGAMPAANASARVPNGAGPDGSQAISFLQNYDETLREFGSRQAHRNLLLLAEWRARSAWGDCPDIHEFATANALAVSDLRSELDALAQMHVQVTYGKKEWECPVTGQFEIGRQDVGEPPPPLWIVDKERLLVSPLSQTVISRRQLRISRVRLREVEIANTSRNVVIAVRRTRLPPSESLRTTLPLELGLGSAHVLLTCNFLPN